MAVKMMRWRPWPPLLSRKYEVRLVVVSLEGLMENTEAEVAEKERGATVEIRWKGPKIALSSFRRTVKRNFTREECVGPNGIIVWDEEFQNVCNLSGYKDNVFHPWEIGFTVLNGVNLGPKNKVSVVGTASLNLAEFAEATEAKEFEVNIPLTLSSNASVPFPLLSLSLSLLELNTAKEPTEMVQRAILPVSFPPQSGETLAAEKDELSAIKAGLRKVKIFTEYVSTRRAKKACHEEEGSEGRCSSRSEEGDYTYPFDSDTGDEFERGSDQGKEDSAVRKSFSYGTLAYANCAGGAFYSNVHARIQNEDWIYYSNRKSDVGCSHMEDTAASVSDSSSLQQNSKRSILLWRKRKLSFRSPKAKGEPLLKKAYGEEGGDDIDFDRRQLSSDESLFCGWPNKVDEESITDRSSVSEFGDDNFAVGCWQQKEVTSRDGHMKLQTQVFFASIDQRSEKAAGESACTALVAVIADWLQNNHNLMPIKSQFDSLIREGSLEWRNLCENQTYRERFPDKHFDLETVLQAKIRSPCVNPSKSFIGFFHPNGMGEEKFDFLQGAMSFDNIWDEISHKGSECSTNCESHVYIVSWNDHFFVLKVEAEAYYIIDTLGERLYEGCSQAYILKFDRDTTICKLPSAAQPSDENPGSEPKNSQALLLTPKVEDATEGAEVSGTEQSMEGEEEFEVVCKGKESCKEYIKSFLAAIPIRELQVDIKKGLMASTPLHHRLQIEFHYTQLQQTASKFPAMEVSETQVATAMPQVVDVGITAQIAA